MRTSDEVNSEIGPSFRPSIAFGLLSVILMDPVSLAWVTQFLSFGSRLFTSRTAAVVPANLAWPSSLLHVRHPRLHAPRALAAMLPTSPHHAHLTTSCPSGMVGAKNVHNEDLHEARVGPQKS